MQISLNIGLFSHFFFSKNDSEIEPVVLHTLNPMNSTKWETSFSQIFPFSVIDFSKKIFENFFTNARCLWDMWNYVQGQKRRKLILGGIMASFAECQDQSENTVAGEKMRKLLFARRMLAPSGNITEFDKHWILGLIKLASI